MKLFCFVAVLPSLVGALQSPHFSQRGSFSHDVKGGNALLPHSMQELSSAMGSNDEVPAPISPKTSNSPSDQVQPHNPLGPPELSEPGTVAHDAHGGSNLLPHPIQQLESAVGSDEIPVATSQETLQQAQPPNPLKPAKFSQPGSFEHDTGSGNALLPHSFQQLESALGSDEIPVATSQETLEQAQPPNPLKPAEFSQPGSFEHDTGSGNALLPHSFQQLDSALEGDQVPVATSKEVLGKAQPPNPLKPAKFSRKGSFSHDPDGGNALLPHSISELTSFLKKNEVPVATSQEVLEQAQPPNPLKPAKLSQPGSFEHDSEGGNSLLPHSVHVLDSASGGKRNPVGTSREALNQVQPPNPLRPAKFSQHGSFSHDAHGGSALLPHSINELKSALGKDQVPVATSQEALKQVQPHNPLEPARLSQPGSFSHDVHGGSALLPHSMPKMSSATLKNEETLDAVSSEFLNLWSEQVSVELSVSQLYLNASIWFRECDFHGMAAWMLEHSGQEHCHGMELLEYATEKNFDIESKALLELQFNWQTPFEVWEDILNAEQAKTQNLQKLAAIAEDLNEYVASAFLQPFVIEQLETEDKVGGILSAFREQPGLLRDWDQKLGIEAAEKGVY